MRVQGKRSAGPSWVVGVVGFVVLLLIVQAFQSRSGAQHPLSEHFAAAPPAPGQYPLSLPPLPTDVAAFARTAVARLASGQQAAALTPVAASGTVRITIGQLLRTGQGLHITGQIANIGQQPFNVSLDQFHFTDDTGTLYAAQVSAKTTVGPGQSVPLDLTLPIPDPHALTLEVSIPGQAPIKMLLLQGK